MSVMIYRQRRPLWRILVYVPVLWLSSHIAYDCCATALKVSKNVQFEEVTRIAKMIFFVMLFQQWMHICNETEKKIIKKPPVNFSNHHIFISCIITLKIISITRFFPFFSTMCVCTVWCKLLHAVCTFRYYQNSVCRGHTWFSRGDNLSNNLHLPFGGFGFWTT